MDRRAFFKSMAAIAAGAGAAIVNSCGIAAKSVTTYEVGWTGPGHRRGRLVTDSWKYAMERWTEELKGGAGVTFMEIRDGKDGWPDAI